MFSVIFFNKRIGALTSKPYAFRGRSWELKSIESIDILDSLCSNIRIDIRGLQIMRILPKLNEYINEEWISDKTRFFFDGLFIQRIGFPLIRQNNQLNNISWAFAYKKLINMFLTVNVSSIKVIIGELTDLESIYILKRLLNKLNIYNYTFYINNFFKVFNDFRTFYLFNIDLINFINVDLFFLINLNLRVEAPLINIRIRQAILKNSSILYSLGIKLNLLYKDFHISNSLIDFLKIVEGTHWFSNLLLKSKNSCILVNNILNFSYNNSSFYYLLKQLQIQLLNCSINNLFTHSSYLNAMELNFNNNFYNSFSNSFIKLFYLIGVGSDFNVNPNAEYIYQGHHGFSNLNNMSLILPTSTFVEKSVLYINLNGFVQKTNIALTSPKDVKNDFIIFNELNLLMFEFVSLFNNIKFINKLYLNLYLENFYGKQFSIYTSYFYYLSFYINNSYFISVNNNFYMTDLISKSSSIMSLCTLDIYKVYNNILKSINN